VQFSTSRTVKISVFYRSSCRPVVRQMLQVFRKCYERLSTASTGELGRYRGSLLLAGLIQKGPSDALKNSSIKQSYSFLISNFRCVLNVVRFLLGNSLASGVYIYGISTSTPGNYPKQRIQKNPIRHSHLHFAFSITLNVHFMCMRNIPVNHAVFPTN
jgi:hypothetical protein